MKEIYADFLGIDIYYTIKGNYTNMLGVLNNIVNGDMDLLVEVLGKLIKKYARWQDFSVKDIMADESAVAIAITSVSYERFYLENGFRLPSFSWVSKSENKLKGYIHNWNNK